MPLNTSSLNALKDSFEKIYKAAALRFHPDKKDPDAEEKMRELNKHKEWINKLTETEFLSSSKS